MTNLKLGKAPATYDSRDLLLSSYVDKATILPKVPKSFGHDHFVGTAEWGMLGNGPDDTVEPGFQGAGDCVFAGAAHETMLYTAAGGDAPARFTGKEVISDYSAVTGYVIGDDSTDQGTNVRDALNYRRKTGVLDADGQRHKIAAYAAIEPGDWDSFLLGIYLFGAVGIGIEFPASAMDQFDQGKTWNVAAGRVPIEGGHYIPCVARHGNTKLVTWSREIGMSKAFFTKYCDEAYAILSPEYLGDDAKSPEGFDLAALKRDLAAL